MKKARPDIPYEYTLRVPIRRIVNGVEGEPITKITILRRARLKDLKAVAGLSPIAQFGAALERLSDLPKGFVDEVDVEDVEVLNGEVIAPLFGEEGQS